MKGDFSRLTGLKAKRKHYNGVLKQQGRVQLDADWNELVAIDAHRQRMRTIDTIGYCGAPVHNSGFQILHPGNGLQDLLISSGRFYAGGLLCESSPSSKLPIRGFAATSEILLDDLRIDGVLLAVGQWVQAVTTENPVGIFGKITQVKTASVVVDFLISSIQNDHHPQLKRLILYSLQPDHPNAGPYQSVAGQKDLVYLDVWERHITAIEDPELREVALGGPDTDTRTKVIAQVKILPDVGDVQCADIIPKWDALIKVKNGRLSTSLTVPDAPDSPCELGESGGFHGLENRLYRVEIHDFARGNRPRFKWSRDNAAFAYAIEEFFEESGGAVFKISLKQNGKDDILKIKPQDWIEITGDETDLDTDRAGTMTRVLTVEGNILTLDADISAHKDEHHPKVRRWDISNQRPDVLTNVVAGTKIPLEDGVEIEFSGTEFSTGAYWVFAARTLTGDIEILEKEAPLGIEHHYCKLGILTGLPRNNVEIEDCRPEFPPLTELPDSGDCCSITISPAPDWWAVFLTFKRNQDISVCFEPGEYLLDQTIVLSGLGNIKFTGAGKGTRIVVRGYESAFRFDNCRDVIIQDLSVASETSVRDREEASLNGALSMYDCEDVSLENVTLSCAHANEQKREATCVSIRKNTLFNQDVSVERVSKITTVNIRNCELFVGAFQTGILVVNADVTHIEANRVTPLDRSASRVVYQGIVVAGQMGRLIHVQDNTVEGVLQGIHLGFSNEKINTEQEFFQAGTVHVSRNYIQTLMLNREHSNFERHGIFVGNCNSIVINDNFITLLRGVRLAKDFRGIDVVGHWGRRMIVRHNHLEGEFRGPGIVVDAIPALASSPLWIVEENVARVLANDPQVIVRGNV